MRITLDVPDSAVAALLVQASKDNLSFEELAVSLLAVPRRPYSEQYALDLAAAKIEMLRQIKLVRPGTVFAHPYVLRDIQTTRTMRLELADYLEECACVENGYKPYQGDLPGNLSDKDVKHYQKLPA